VPWGARAEHVVVVADDGGAPMIALVAGGSARTEADASLAREPRDTLTWSAAPVVAAAALKGRLGPRPVWAGGALVRAAQMAGGLEFLLAQSVKYVTERKQFGRPLAAFQAIQQNLALLAGHTAAAAMAAQQAFHVVERTGEGGDASFEIAVAKVRTGEAAGLGAGIAHQAHGAIGFTYEHSLHFVTRRLWSWRAEFGAESHWSVALGRRVAAQGADALWPRMAGA
jgi:acyl-CoA dehydrogenase